MWTRSRSFDHSFKLGKALADLLFIEYYHQPWASLVAQTVKSLPALQ